MPPPTTIGERNSWHSSTSPARNALAARPGPPTVRSASADAFSRRTASGSKSRSIRVLAVATVSSVLEYTTLSAARQIPAKSPMAGDWSPPVGMVSQTASVSYMRRPSR